MDKKQKQLEKLKEISKKLNDIELSNEKLAQVNGGLLLKSVYGVPLIR